MSAAPDHRIVRALLEAAENPDAPLFELQRLRPEQAIAAAPHLRSLVELWDARRGDRAVPDRADIDFADFRGWHSAIVVSDLEGEEPDPLFRIVGEDYRIVDYGTTGGQRFSDRTPRLYEQQFRQRFAEIRDSGLIGWSVGAAAIVGREHVRLKVLELPFTNGGPQVSRLVHVMSYDFAGDDREEEAGA